MFARMMLGTKSQALIVLLVLACQLLVPAWHHISHPHSDSPSDLTQHEHTCLAALDHLTSEDEDECPVCEYLARTTSLAFVQLRS